MIGIVLSFLTVSADNNKLLELDTKIETLKEQRYSVKGLRKAELTYLIDKLETERIKVLTKLLTI